MPFARVCLRPVSQSNETISGTAAAKLGSRQFPKPVAPETRTSRCKYTNLRTYELKCDIAVQVANLDESCPVRLQPTGRGESSVQNCLLGVHFLDLQKATGRYSKGASMQDFIASNRTLRTKQLSSTPVAIVTTAHLVGWRHIQLQSAAISTHTVTRRLKVTLCKRTSPLAA